MPTLLFSYDPLLLSHRDWVRYLLGDTNLERAEVDDRELDALLADQAEPDDDEPTAEQWRAYRASVAARAADAVAAKYAREADVSFDQQRIGLSAKFHQYAALAKRLRSEARSTVPLKVIRV